MPESSVKSLDVPVQTAKLQGNLPFLDLKAQFATIRDEILSAVTGVLDSQHFILGPEVEAFEREVSAYTGARFAIGCASGSDALLLALLALEVAPGNEIITTPFTFVATAGAIARIGAKPVFVDIEPATFNIDPALIGNAVTPRTRAILPVHLFGLAADMDTILKVAAKRELPVIEDAAQSIGARYHGETVGNLGAMGCFSFFPSKNLGGAGDGGMITTNDQKLAERLRLLRVHGSRKKYQYEIVGINSRLDALQSAILRVKLRYLEAWAEGRRRNADRYRAFFAELALTERVTLPQVPAKQSHVYNQFVIRVAERDALRAFLKERGIPTEVYYPSPLHLERAYQYLGHKAGAFPVAEAASKQVIALPIYPELQEDQQASIVSTIAEFYRTR
ncbi:MAG TPA: DegT/DnrJ/EryC1/StrS family aminotransferase, partial [Candidatus Acidoferrales bacterium]|nr:DegT/DnrJ/EryC1/StrS family aminotransferase [Candidatus Acidoferrales bacterium]